MKTTLLIIGCAVMIAMGLYFFRTKPDVVVPVVRENIKEVILGNTLYMLEVVSTDPLRQQGLSYRTELAPQTGMLFVFDAPGVYGFWMKDMNFPIDIIWLDADKKVVHIEHSLSPSTYPNSFGPTIPTQYVIELGAGEVQHIELSFGYQVDF